MSADHTPGTWTILETPNYQGEASMIGAEIVGRNRGTIIAEIVGAVKLYGDDHPENMANARLIAATPDMLEALDSIRVYANDTLSGRVGGPADAQWYAAAVLELRNRARAAIAKATGGA